MGAGWQIGTAIPLELDMILMAISGSFLPQGLPERFTALLNAIPDDWRAEMPEMLGEPRSINELIGTAAVLAGTLLEGDYSSATLAIRQLSLEAALAQVQLLAETLDQPMSLPDGQIPLSERLVEAYTAVIAATYRQYGFEPAGGSQDSLQVRRARRSARQVVRLLPGGDLHLRFWHWLDRFYYGVYSPWRQVQANELQALERRAEAFLGASSATGDVPNLSWLSNMNPLVRYQGLHDAVQDGRLWVFFWVEPFGLSDLWALLPGQVMVSFAEPGVLYEKFLAQAEDVARRAQALADPTRLIILRMIRNFGMINTEIADYLGLSRPTVSVHAKLLREAGLIHSEQDGRAVRHTVEPQALRQLFKDLQAFLDLDEE